MADNEILTSRLRLYCNVNAYDLGALKANLERPGNEGFRETFRAGLAAAATGKGLTRAEYETLTGDSFDEDAEYLADLARVYQEIYGEAPPG